jgi:hypothetical protein
VVGLWVPMACLINDPDKSISRFSEDQSLDSRMGNLPDELSVLLVNVSRRRLQPQDIGDYALDHGVICIGIHLT